MIPADPEPSPAPIPMPTSSPVSLEDLKKVSASFPDAAGVYLFKNAQGKVIYVGKALSLKKRTASYFNSAGQDSPKVRALTRQSASLEYVLTEDENQALLLESNLIKKHRPRYNVVLRDDKSYPYLKLTVQEDFPRILVSRRTLSDGARYYGPYPNMKVREIVKIIHRFFNLRDCDMEIDGKAERACVSFQIRQCPAPCTAMVNKADYAKLVKRVRWFLEGRHEELIGYVRGQMHAEADRQEFEEAAKLRDLLGSLEQFQGESTVLTLEKRDMDAVALAQGLGKVLASVLRVRQGKVVDHARFTLDNEMEQDLMDVLPLFLNQLYSGGLFIPEEILVAQEFPLAPEAAKRLGDWRGGDVQLTVPKEEWRKQLMAMAESNVLSALREDLRQMEVLKELQELLGLSQIPRLIACFDISTLQGAHTVGSAVLFRDGAPDKDRYRKFKIREQAGQDDFRAHEEMMRRYIRLVGREGLPLPDLFLIDGGKGQLSSVYPVLQNEIGQEFGLASLAKREEEVFVPGKPEPVDFRGHLKARFLLQRVRDESHRFAVGYHRNLRDKQTLDSLLQQVKGIGPSRLRALFNRFETLQQMKEAPLDDLASVPGFSRELATRLYEAFHPA
jgi:excinuclease ABC subunit C